MQCNQADFRMVARCCALGLPATRNGITVFTTCRVVLTLPSFWTVTWASRPTNAVDPLANVRPTCTTQSMNFHAESSLERHWALIVARSVSSAVDSRVATMQSSTLSVLWKDTGTSRLHWASFACLFFLWCVFERSYAALLVLQLSCSRVLQSYIHAHTSTHNFHAQSSINAHTCT